MNKKLSNDAAVLQKRTAFALFLTKGINEVKRLYPGSVNFVKKNQGKTLKEVTQLLTEELNAHNKMAIPVSAK